MQSLFITGTDTDIGKTYVTAGLAASFYEMGIDIGVMKPFAAGTAQKNGFKSEDLEILSRANDVLSIPIIASGGVGSIEHFYEGVKVGKADALLAASVFHFNEFSIMDVKNYLKEKNIEVRI